MDATEACVVNLAVRDALRDARALYDANGILVVATLAAKSRLATHEEAVYQAVYTIFRGLPARLAPGVILHVATEDRAGGDVELTWEAREARAETPAEGTPAEAARAVLRKGPYGDLLDVAVEALTEVCRARAVHVEREADALPARFGTAGRLDVRRRFSFLIPSLRREGTYHAPGGR